MQNKRAWKLTVAGVAAAGIIGGGTFAYAAVPSSSTGRFTGCHGPGAPLRLIDADAGQTCNAGETKVSWGGGMRFRGVWKVPANSTGPGMIPYNSISDPVQKGDVIRYDGPSRHFGCTTPKGSWVNVVGSHAYPCLEYPQNWAPLALDGPQGSNADVRWVKVDAAGKLAGSSDAGTTTYAPTPGSPYTWINVTWGDPSKCALSATTTAMSRYVISTQPYGGPWVLVTMIDEAGRAQVGVPFDVTMSCGKYS